MPYPVASAIRRSARCERGTSMFELAICLSLVVLLASSAMDISRALRSRQVLAEVARNGVRSVARFAAAKSITNPMIGCEDSAEPPPVADPAGSICHLESPIVETNEQYEVCSYPAEALSTCDQLLTDTPTNLGQVVKRTVCEGLRDAGLDRAAEQWTVAPELWRGTMDGRSWRYMKVTVSGELDCALCSALGTVTVRSSYTLPVPAAEFARCSNV